MPIHKQQFYSTTDSWMSYPVSFNQDELLYLQMLEKVWKVPSGNDWIPYELAPHQINWHKDDVVIKKELAPIRVVIKSRNTSFTVSSLISLLTSISQYKNLVIPLTCLNTEKATDLIQRAKQLIKHMTPIVYEDIDEKGNKCKVYWPFNPDNVDMKNVKSIKLHDDYGDLVTEIRAFPAYADSSESIRSIRTIGHAGIIDESNFMRYFKSIYTALRDSSVGEIKGKHIHQFDIGTTLKGETPFYEWYESQKKKDLKNIKFYDWPVFERSKFTTEIPFHENEELIPIVEWHSKSILWEKYLEDENIFLEEYMAQKIDSDLQFYSTMLLLSCHVLDTQNLEEIDFSNYEKITIGIDPASTKDYFAISVFGWQNNEKKELFLDYENKIDLPQSKQKCRGILNTIKNQNRNWMCTIDSTPIGLDLYQTLQQEYGAEHVRGVTGNKKVTVTRDNKIKLNEYGHTEMKRMMNSGEVSFILDDLSLKHFQSITYKFQPENTEYGHGDIAMARLYALLPNNLNSVMKSSLKTNLNNDDDMDKPEEEEDALQKIKRMKRMKRRRIK